MWWEREPARATRWETEKIYRTGIPWPAEAVEKYLAEPIPRPAVVGVPNGAFAPVLYARSPGYLRSGYPTPRLLLPTFLLEPLQVEGEQILQDVFVGDVGRLGVGREDRSIELLVGVVQPRRAGVI
jgi:hypothetical protein